MDCEVSVAQELENQFVVYFSALTRKVLGKEQETSIKMADDPTEPLGVNLAQY
jgi:hypothetical protein